MTFSFTRKFKLALLTLPLVSLAACNTVRHVKQSCVGDTCDTPEVCHSPSMMSIACDLDHLEKHIDCFGSVVAKTPNVWGEARLTSSRQETETYLKNELGGFRVSNQGSFSRTDVADLIVSLNIKAGTATQDSTSQATTEAEKATKAASEATEAAAKATKAASEAGASAEAVKAASDAAAKAATAAAAAAEKVAAAAGGKPIPASDTPAGIVAEALAGRNSLEPNKILDQKANYLNHLHGHRRTNEGDDTSDAPGYAMNLVNIPVSVLPGKHTDRGHGAEVTFTVNPILDNDLLPKTFKDLVINDAVHVMAFPMTKLLEEEGITDSLCDDELRKIMMTDRKTVVGKQNVDLYLKNNNLLNTQGKSPPPKATFFRQTGYGSFSKVLAYSTDVRGNRAYPPTTMIEVLGPTFTYEILRLVNTLSDNATKERSGFVHMPDVQTALKEHLVAGYRFLARPEAQILWKNYCTPELVSAVRNRQQDALNELRYRFRNDVQLLSNTPYKDAQDPLLQNEAYGLDKLVQYSATTGLAWAIIVHSALLNERLKEDMNRTGAVKNVPSLCGEIHQEFFQPVPSPDARNLFNEYVKNRWPIRVFTIDPTTDDQNIADSLTMTRNSQLTLTLAFLYGKVSTNSYTNAVRKLNFQFDTIALNRTQVGFAHGDNTFGWRFYPRFQTASTQSNATVFLRDNIIGGPTNNALLRQRHLEPGMRECVALVLMPSFVPYATIDSTSNWFSLTNPKHKSLDHTQALKLSRRVQAIRNESGNVKDACNYRDVDQKLLMNRTEQLASRLPTQTNTFQVPVLNTLGGFELFGNATTDLAPELYGWYGASGAKDGMRLFLVGDHFSVNQTRVLVGNREAEIKRMLSRQVMEILIPGDVSQLPAQCQATMKPCDGKPEVVCPHFHIHIATPYGVSRDLEVPLIITPTPECKEKDKEKPRTPGSNSRKSELAPMPIRDEKK